MFSNIKRILQFLAGEVKECKVLVVGDVMLDNYYFGEVKRISPEAPVPVVKVLRENKNLGGAGNVANNLAHLGCRVSLGGVIGDDDSGKNLCLLLEEQKIDYMGLTVTTRPTITKTRVIGENQQMFRLDFEEVKPLEDSILKKLDRWFSDKLAGGIDTVILSDYGKGVCTPKLCQLVIKKCKEKNIPVIVDPKGADWNKYSEADFITPNLHELSEVRSLQVKNDDEEVVKHGTRIRGIFKVKNLLVTRSEKGMSLLNDNGFVHIPTRAQEIFDVSGAGDTVVAVLAALIAGGINIIDTVKIANVAAGIVVGKLGTQPISVQELLDYISYIEDDLRVSRKLLTLSRALELVNKWRKEGCKIVFTNGCFDILHIGHIHYLEKARKLGDRLLVGLNSDASIRRIKGEKRPIMMERDRAKMLAALEFVDGVILFDEDTPERLICALKPDILVKGGDYQVEDVVGKECAENVEIIPFVDGYSTSGIIKRILDKYRLGGKSVS